MLLFKRIVLVSALLLVTQCSFRPLYSSYDGVAVEKLSHIKISNIEGRLGQVMRNSLLQKMMPGGEPDRPLYTLDVEMNFSNRDLGIAKDATTTRSEVTLTVLYKLRDNKSGKILLEGKEQESADYNMLTKSYYSNVVSQENTREGTVELMSDLIKLALASYLGDKESS